MTRPPSLTRFAIFTVEFFSHKTKVRENSHAIAEKAEKDVQMWIEGQLGRELPGSLGDSLRSGHVLCELMNKIKPGCVPKFHAGTRMAFKMMENIGWFLEACKEFGVADTDLFMTVDLFDFANLKQVSLHHIFLLRYLDFLFFKSLLLHSKVVICINALRKKAISVGLNVS
jgi:hypothetical protein